MDPSINSTNFEQFLINHTLDEICTISNNLSKEAETKKKLETIAKDYFEKDTEESPEKNKLKIKSWFLLSATSLTLESEKFLSSIKITPQLKKAMIKNSAREGEDWRIQRLDGIAINLRLPTQRNQLLALACEQGNAHLVTTLLGEHLAKTPSKNHNFSERFENALLFKAADKQEIVYLLIEAGINIDAKNFKGETALHQACAEGNADKISNLLLLGANTYAKDLNGLTPLHLAFKNDYIEAGAKIVNRFPAILLCYDHLNRTPLDYLREKDETKALKFLEILCERKDYDLLATSIKYGFANYAISLLIEKEKTEDLRIFLNSPKGKKLLLKATDSIPPNLDLIKFLISKGADPNVVDSKGDLPIFNILKNPPIDLSILNLLIQAGASLTALTKDGVQVSAEIKFHGIDLHSPDTERYDEEYLLRKVLSGSWGIKHKSPMEAGGPPISFQGGTGEFGKIQNIELLKGYKDQIGSFADLDDLFQVIEEATNASCKNPKEVAKLFKDGKPLIFNTGWSEHVVSVVFYDDYMLVCNRGDVRKESAVSVFKINRESFDLTEENILRMQMANAPSIGGAQFLYEVLPLSLGYDRNEQDPIAEIIESHCLRKDQKTGNCWWLGPKTANMALIMIKSLVDQQSTPYEEVLRTGDIIYKHYSEYSRLMLLKKYIERPQNEIPRDHELIKNIALKLESKKWQYIFKTKTSPAVVASLNDLLGPKNEVLPLFTKKEVRGWLKEYRDLYRLNDHYEALPA